MLPPHLPHGVSPPQPVPAIAPLIGDARLRSGGFSIASHDRRNIRLWKTRGSEHLFSEEEAHEIICRLLANHFYRDGCGGWLFESDTYTTIEALDFIDRLDAAYARHR